jgi:DNA polymerase-3 subunit beta
MKFKINRNKLLTTLQIAVNFTSPKNVNTILQNILIEANDDSITIKANNTQTGFSGEIDTEVEEIGSTTISGRKFLDVIKELPEESIIDFNFDGRNLKIKSGKSSFTLSTITPEQFPTMSEIVPEYNIVVESKKLLEALKKTSFCISNDKSKIEYTGAHFKVFGNILEISSSDIQRIAKATLTFDEEFSDEFIINIPKKTIMEVMKILEFDEKVEIETDKQQIIFKIDNMVVYSKLLVKYIRSLTKLFDSKSETKARIPSEEFYEVIKRVSTISSDITHGVVLSFEDSKLSVYSIETEYGQGFEIIDDIEFNGENIDIIFNSKHLLDITLNITTEYLDMHISGKRTPAILNPVGDDSYSYLVVPISIEYY